MKKLLSFILIIFILSGCKDSQWVMKQTDKNVKYTYLQKFYKQGKYSECFPIIESMLPSYKGTDTAEQLYFMLAECYFFSKEYSVAAYHYKTYRDLYPRSYKSEVALFKTAESYKSQIPRVDLEQTDTEKAIEYYNKFIAEYPKSAMSELAYEHIKELKRVLELKALNAANLYYKTGNYRAAAVTFKNVLSQYPNIKEYEELLYKVSLSYYQFAEESILTKQSDRYETALNEGNLFLNRFPKSKFAPEISEMTLKCKSKILESAFDNAQFYITIGDRPLYYHKALSLYDEFAPEIKSLPSKLTGFKDKCYLGILKSYYVMTEDSKDNEDRDQNYKLFLENYYVFVSKFSSNSIELKESESLFQKINQLKKS